MVGEVLLCVLIAPTFILLTDSMHNPVRGHQPGPVDHGFVLALFLRYWSAVLHLEAELEA